MCEHVGVNQRVERLPGPASDATHPPAADDDDDVTQTSDLILHECDFVLSVVPTVH